VPTATPGSGTIVLDWADVTDADSYKVQVSSDAGVTWANLATPTPSTYTHTVTTGQTRHYRIAAVSTADGAGEYSTTVNATAA
jgi:fibronectin type 3 domain-containing protein